MGAVAIDAVAYRDIRLISLPIEDHDRLATVRALLQDQELNAVSAEALVVPRTVSSFEDLTCASAVAQRCLRDHC